MEGALDEEDRPIIAVSSILLPLVVSAKEFAAVDGGV